jgi:hypothetical protein
MPKKPSITIRRSGTFSCHNLVLTNRCGKEGRNEFNFRIEIEVDSLDERGFVCDNFDVPTAMNFWNGLEFWQASCEDFAGGGVRLMHKLCKRAKRILCEVSPIPEAGVRVEWKKGQSLPNFFPKQVNPSPKLPKQRKQSCD